MLHHNIDSLLIRKDYLLLSGWGFLTSHNVTRLILQLDFDNEMPSLEIEVDYGRRRDDVKVLFADMPEAGNAGFFLLAGFNQQKITRARLRWELNENQVLETPLEIPRNEKLRPIDAIKHYVLLFSKASKLIRSAGLIALIRKTNFYLSAKPKSASDTEWERLYAKLRRRTVTIIVDHDMGGGANIYRNKYVAEQWIKGELVLLLGFHIASLQYFVEVFDTNSSHRYLVDSPDSLLRFAAHGVVRHVIYNCAVSFPQPLAVINTLIALKQNADCQLLVMVHDYFMVCPSHFLINNNGQFCGVPNESHCESCLPYHRDGFVSIGGVRDIIRWRKEWSRLLIAADKVHMFSESSWHLLKKAFPLLNDTTWCVVPHDLHTEVPKVNLRRGSHLHIGIVGTIGKHKGAQIVRELALEITQRNSNVRITVIGTLEAKVPSNVVTITGAYEPKQLPEIIKNSGANVFLFPSIWAETFSYVSHELVAMGVLFACFDFGAPADLARRYEKGLILNSMDAGDILDDLESFWRAFHMVEEKTI